MLRASPLSIGIALVLAAVAVVGFVVSRDSAKDQERSLLQSDANQAALYAGSVFSQVGGLLDSLATGVTLTGGDPAAFTRQAAPYAAGGSLSLVLARSDGHGNYTSVAAAGRAYAAGQGLPRSLSAALGAAGMHLDPTAVSFDGHTSTAGFAVGPPLVPSGFAVYLQFGLDPFLPSKATAAKTFSMLDAALYGGPSAVPSSLLVATTHAVPLSGDVATAHMTVGTATWTLVAKARSPLTGGLAALAPVIILLLGLIFALSVGAVVEMLHRRQRYAAVVVAERTAELEQSLVELRATQRALVRAERLTAVGEMASVVGHELRNPLAAVTNAFFLLRRALGEPAPAPVERHLAMAERETAKAASLAEDLVSFVRPREPRKEPVDLELVVREVTEASPPPAGVTVEVDVDPLVVHADHRQLAEILTNLVVNAYQAIGEAGSSHGAVRITGHMEGPTALLSVEDDGPGIDGVLSDQVFEPFFTTKHDGTGLGLAIVRRLIEAHDGEVTLERRAEGPGARVVVRIPATGATVESLVTAGAEGRR